MRPRLITPFFERADTEAEHRRAKIKEEARKLGEYLSNQLKVSKMNNVELEEHMK